MEEGGNLHVQNIPTCRHGAWRGGAGQHPVGYEGKMERLLERGGQRECPSLWEEENKAKTRVIDKTPNDQKYDFWRVSAEGRWRVGV